MSSLRTPLKRARGLGAAKEGAHHWIYQRLTAIALIPLFIWFMSSIVIVISSDTNAILWLQSPMHAFLCIFFLIVMFWHGSLGIQVVLEDYVSCHAKKVFYIFLSKILCAAGAVAGIFSVLSIYLKG